MNICHYATLSKNLQTSVCQMTAGCRLHDQSSLSYPFSPKEGADCHYLAANDLGELCAVLAVIPLDSNTAEISAFTRPDQRKKGCFSRLLALALNDYEDFDFLFAVSPRCKDTLATLDALDAEFSHEEHQMEFLLDRKQLPDISSPSHAGFTLTVPENILSPGAQWLLVQEAKLSSPIGSCLTSPVSPDCLCLHQVRITPSLRGQGLGRLLIRQLLWQLGQTDISRVVLHVSGDNIPALSLYKKTGFRITETLSYYYY